MLNQNEGGNVKKKEYGTQDIGEPKWKRVMKEISRKTVKESPTMTAQKKWRDQLSLFWGMWESSRRLFSAKKK